MPAREPPAQPLEATQPRVGAVSAQASAADCESDDLARAEVRAEAARARALRLRRQAEAASRDQGPAHPAEADADYDAQAAPAADGPASARSRRRRLWRPGRKALAVAAAVLSICASLSGSGYLVWHHNAVVQERQRAAEFSAMARKAIIMMISIEPGKAREEMQRFADDTTGLFKASILMSAEQFVKAVEDSKINSKGAVQAVAVQSMSKDGAVVLVAAKSEISKPDQPKPQSRALRVAVTVQRESGQLKVSRIEMVP